MSKTEVTVLRKYFCTVKIKPAEDSLGVFCRWDFTLFGCHCQGSQGAPDSSGLLEAAATEIVKTLSEALPTWEIEMASTSYYERDDDLLVIDLNMRRDVNG